MRDSQNNYFVHFYFENKPSTNWLLQKLIICHIAGDSLPPEWTQLLWQTSAAIIYFLTSLQMTQAAPLAEGLLP